MAAALALAFQSSHLQDGMAEFLTMVRGCNLIAGDEALMNSDSVFHVSPARKPHGTHTDMLRLSVKTVTWRPCAAALAPRD
jgi:hypothetical protein